MKNYSLLILTLLVICAATFATPKTIKKIEPPKKVVPPGGLGSVQQPNDVVRGHVIKLDREIKDKVCLKLGGTPGEGECKEDHKLTVLGFKTQTVAGTNYFIKVKCDTGKVWHVRIYESFSGDVELSKVDGPKTEADEIVYFE